jgi:hypothetical protein
MRNPAEWISAETEPKEQDFRGLLDMHITICKHIRRRWPGPPYLFADLYAGPGHLEYQGREFLGSPLIFRDLAIHHQLRYEALYFEKNQDTAGQLAKAIATLDGRGRTSIHAEACETGFSRWLDLTGHQPDRYGLVYADPIHDEIPHALLNKAARLLPRVDLLSYVAATQYKRRRGVDSTRPYLCDHIAAVDKQLVLIREPIGAWQWTFILWSNWVDFPQWERRGFHHLDSARGQRILNTLTYTEQQRYEMVNTPLPFLPTVPMPNTSAIPSSSPSEPWSSSGPAGSASDAASDRQPSPTISPTRPGEPSTSLRTSSPSAIPATAERTGRSGDGES